MGVKSCHRRDCEQIMCDTYVSGTGYVCNECQHEFQEYLNKNGHKPENEFEIEILLKAFMDTSKGHYENHEKMSVDEFFNKHTK